MEYLKTKEGFINKAEAENYARLKKNRYKRNYPTGKVVTKIFKENDLYTVFIITDFDVTKNNTNINKNYNPKNTLINKITIRSVEELLSHESIVREAYKDSKGIWTWSVGITISSGHKVYPRYKDNPQSLKRCLELFEYLIRMEYLPTVEEVFEGFNLTEEQIAAALSFHYNTGGLHIASWAKEWKNGDTDKAYKSFLNWKKPASIESRRKKERDLLS